MTASWIIAWLLAYLVGSIPFGLLLGKAKGVDIRAHGSGNIGATNAMRVLGRRLGITCFVLDVCKGVGPVLGAGVWFGLLASSNVSALSAGLWVATGLAAVVGHMFPVWLRFRGGKGVATGFGAMLAMWPVVTLPAAVALAVWVLVLKATRYVSVASCAAALALPVGVLAMSAMDIGRRWPFLALTAGLAALVVWRHRGNLARVRRGEEPRIGDSGRSHAATSARS